MARRLISSGSTFEKLAGYSRAVVDGEFCFVSGTTGYDYSKMAISPDVAEQTEQCFANIRKALAEAGFALEDTVRVQIHLTHAGDFDKVAPIVGKHFADIRPANTTVVSQLLNSDMKIEIEVTAKKRSP
ncbi:MAG: RidA family protein [Azospirillum sp.]|nr:RidA family protein [Azospirillum sp.]